MIAGLLARHPARLRARAGDPRHDLVPRRRRPAGVEHADAAGVGEEVTEGDPLLAVDGEFGEVPGHRIVELQPAALPELGDGHRRDRLGGGEPEHQVVGGERLAGAVLAERRVGHPLAAERDVELRPQMEPRRDPRLEGRRRPRQPRPPLARPRDLPRHARSLQPLGGCLGRRRHDGRPPGAARSRGPRSLAAPSGWRRSSSSRWTCRPGGSGGPRPSSGAPGGWGASCWRSSARRRGPASPPWRSRRRPSCDP